MSKCCQCGKEPLDKIEIGATKKFIHRAATEYWCKECMCKRFKISGEYFDMKIEQFKNQGCLLFL